MASTNQSPFYQRAEQEFLSAKTDEERISALEIMIKECPKHKSSENMLKNLKTRLKKFKTKVSKQKKKGGSTKQGIKKQDMQSVLAGFPNTGKSTVFNTLTNQNAKVSDHEFTTYEPGLGTFNFEDAKIQIIDDSPFPNHDKSLINSTDTILLVIDSLDQIKKSEKFLNKSPAKKIIIFNKSDNLNEKELRKTNASLKSKYKDLNFIFFNYNPTKPELEKLKESVFKTFPIIRIYTKEPKKSATKEPMIMKIDSTVENAAEKILKGMSKKIKRARVWGPSSKFPGQVIGLNHKLKDKDIIEFQTI